MVESTRTDASRLDSLVIGGQTSGFIPLDGDLRYAKKDGVARIRRSKPRRQVTADY